MNDMIIVFRGKKIYVLHYRQKTKNPYVSRLNNNTTPNQVYLFRKISVISFLHQKK